MTCAESYANANDFAIFWCIDIAPDEEATINRYLQLGATPIHAARAASGGCDCTLSSWATDYLITLNCILAATTYNCKCSNLRLTNDEKRLYMESTVEDLTLIREGKTELCAGETGFDFPYVGDAAQGVTEWAQARIIANDILRNS